MVFYQIIRDIMLMLWLFGNQETRLKKYYPPANWEHSQRGSRGRMDSTTITDWHFWTKKTSRMGYTRLLSTIRKKARLYYILYQYYCFQQHQIMLYKMTSKFKYNQHTNVHCVRAVFQIPQTQPTWKCTVHGVRAAIQIQNPSLVPGELTPVLVSHIL